MWRIFGPEIAPGVTPKTGCVRFFDAFPTNWPLLEIDVLTPHFSRYYDGKKNVVPADWESPNPVPFLTVAEGQTFRFYFSSTDEERWEGDRAQLEKLLSKALEWLGIGGKKSSGYGQLKKGELPDRPKPLPLQERKEEKRNPVWPNVELKLHQGTPTAYRGKRQSATCRQDELHPELLKALKSKLQVRADVEVVSIPGGFRIVAVKDWRS